MVKFLMLVQGKPLLIKVVIKTIVRLKVVNLYSARLKLRKDEIFENVSKYLKSKTND